MGRPKKPATTTWECPKCGTVTVVVGEPLDVAHRCAKLWGKLARMERKGDDDIRG